MAESSRRGQTVLRTVSELRPEFQVLIGDIQPTSFVTLKPAVKRACADRVVPRFAVSSALDEMLTLAEGQTFDFAILTPPNICGHGGDWPNRMTQVVAGLPRFKARISGPILVICGYPLAAHSEQTIHASGARLVGYPPPIPEIVGAVTETLEQKPAAVASVDSLSPTIQLPVVGHVASVSFGGRTGVDNEYLLCPCREAQPRYSAPT